MKNKDRIVLDSKNYIENRLGVSLESLKKFPRFFLIETIFGCNASCIMCPAKQSKRKKEKMSIYLVQKILDEIGFYKEIVNKVQFYLHGEPCLDLDLPKWVAYSKKIGIKTTHIATNGSLLNHDMSKRLLKAGLDQIYIAVDGETEETVANIRKGLSLKKIKANINEFISLRKALNVNTKIRILMVVQDKNLSEVDSWKNYWQSRLNKTDELCANNITNWGGQIDTGKFYQEINVTKPCVYPFGTMAIMADGTVPLCCEDVNPVYNLGNINDSSILDIWTSEKWAYIIDTHLKGLRSKMKLCKTCDVFRDDKYIIKEQGQTS